MRTLMILAAAMAAAPAIATAAASDNAAVMATVQRFDDSFNKDDIKTMTAMCAPGVVIIDDFAPHVWQGGANACATWASAIDVYDKKNGIVGGPVTLHKPWRVAVTGDHAYVVVPATYAYKQHGKPVVEDGSIWTLVLQKAGAGWRVAAWSWGQH
jgi:ketosteroid isomerase-like protein